MNNAELLRLSMVLGLWCLINSILVIVCMKETDRIIGTQRSISDVITLMGRLISRISRLLIMNNFTEPLGPETQKLKDELDEIIKEWGETLASGGSKK